MRVNVCLGAILIPEYLDFHLGYSAPRSRIAGIYSGIYSYSGISQTNAPLVYCLGGKFEMASSDVLYALLFHNIVSNISLTFYSRNFQTASEIKKGNRY